MAGRPIVNACGPSYHLDDRKAAVQSAINCYPRRIDGDKWVMASDPGEVVIATPGGEIRKSYYAKGRWFVAAGASLYEVTTAGALTLRGTLNSTTGYVGMSHNATQLAVVDGATFYILTLSTNVFTTILSAGWRGSDEVEEMDGYFIFVDPDTDQFYISVSDDGTVLNAIDFSSADSSPDNIITHRVSHRQLLLFGSDSAEIWINSGDAAFPFARYQSYTLDVGIVGKRAAINGADTLFWVGKTERGTGIVYMLAGNQPERVSNRFIEEALARSTDLSQTTMWVRQIGGHEFIGIDAPGMETTLVFDAAMQQWHEAGEWAAGWLPLRSKLVTFVGDKHYAGDSDGNLVRLDETINTRNGRVIRRERTWPHFMDQSMEPVSFQGLEVACATGRGGVIALELSNDGGKTFPLGPYQRSLGVTGRWMQRVRWNGLGTTINRVFRLWQTDNVPFALHAANVSTE